MANKTKYAITYPDTLDEILEQLDAETDQFYQESVIRYFDDMENDFEDLLNSMPYLEDGIKDLEAHYKKGYHYMYFP